MSAAVYAQLLRCMITIHRGIADFNGNLLMSISQVE